MIEIPKNANLPLVAKALREHGWPVSKIAGELGFDKSTIYKWLKDA